MEEQEFSYNPILYIISVIGFITGNIVGDRFLSVDWIPWLIYGFATIGLIVAILRHRTILVSENTIRIKELLRGEKTILKSEVEHYRTTYEYRKTPYTTWYFTMKNGNEIILSHDFMRNEQEISEAVNKWSSELPQEASV